MTAIQFDLFTDVAAEDDLRARRESMRNDRRHDCCDPTELLTVEGRPGRAVQAVRCGRCGTVVPEFDLVINHDRGWCGCGPADPRRDEGRCAQHTDDPHGWMQDRHDRQHVPDCATCEHAWGLHRLPGSRLPGESSCELHCGCDGYLPPRGAVTPWGTCPACWGIPHDGACQGAEVAA